MWSLRRAINPLRSSNINMQIFNASGKQGSKVVNLRSLYIELDVEPYSLGNCNARFTGSLLLLPDRSQFSKRFFNTKCSPQKLFTGTRSLSSQAGTKSSGEEDDPLEDGFSELETSTASDAIQENSSVHAAEDRFSSDPELSEVDVDNGEVEGPEDELGLLNTETDTGKKPWRGGASQKLFDAIIAAPPSSVSKVIEKWMEEGNEVCRSEISVAMLNLRKRNMYGRALQLSEWLEISKHEFLEKDYASRLDLIAKVRGLKKAEEYIEKIPESFKTEVIYRTLLANCVSACNVNKSEEIFNKMKDLELPMTCFAYNQLLLLYKKCDKKKIADVLLLMEQENIKPTPFTYKILIDVKGQSNDITGMEKIVETMKADGIEPDFGTKCILVRHYASAGLKDKAETLVKEMEGVGLNKNRWVCQYLLLLYAALGKANEVGRIWQFCESKPRITECMAAIEAWGKVDRIEEAEAVFDMMLKKFNKLSSKHYCVLLRVYTEHKMLAKGKDLVKRMADSGCYVGPLTWDALVKLYVEAGEVEKADSILHKAAEQNRLQPLFGSYMTIMDQYAKRGDIHNAEKVFHSMRKAGYVGRVRPFQSLIQAYIKAKAPAYGISERMKADNIFPNKALAAQLAQVDAFRKTAVSDLLD